MASVTDLSECYGIKKYHWDLKRAILWGATQPFKFISERFDSVFLTNKGDHALVVADHFSDKAGEEAILSESNWLLTFGSEFMKICKISLVPMVTISQYCPPIQLADLIVGVTVSALAGNRYGNELFDPIAVNFLF
jgi:hypothetical protein